jgi:hypothetical protein
MKTKTFKVAYLTQENGRPVLKIGELIFQDERPCLIVKTLPNGALLTVPIPNLAIPRLQKVNVTLDYIFPDGIALPKEPPIDPSSVN